MLGFNRIHEGDAAPDDDNTYQGFTRKLVETRRNEIEAFSQALKNASLINFISTPEGDDAFTHLIALAVNDYGVSQKHLASAISVNPATISRWTNGTSLPVAYARGQIVNALSSLIEHELSITT